ncbi:hypothetical protein Bhyg_04279 [Pseudolycoriella hygida]|uniref:Uncharacterized protein n=1 Tax=Pseudolycoriella hygida TaxID=35572 RepID=A0A9Q0NF10_9DIPT|nr:hypothetical protein Bhyg_04279 [Pseudolycoriella hygida]
MRLFQNIMLSTRMERPSRLDSWMFRSPILLYDNQLKIQYDNSLSD